MTKGDSSGFPGARDMKIEVPNFRLSDMVRVISGFMCADVFLFVFLLSTENAQESSFSLLLLLF